MLVFLLTAGVGAVSIASQSAAAAPQPLTITTSSLPAGIAGNSYAATLQASGGTPPYSFWYLKGGSLPRGIRLSKTGVLSGDPVGAGTHVIRFKVRDRSVPRQTAYEDLTIIDTAPNGTGCNYIGQDANWVGCDFAGVGFSGYNLSFSDFTDVDFAGAYMSHAELSYDDFYMDNLTGVDFTQSDLTGAAFSDVSELADVIWNNTICPDGTNSDNDGGTCVNNLN